MSERQQLFIIFQTVAAKELRYYSEHMYVRLGEGP